MLLSDIYNTASALISEAPDGADNADLREKAVYLLYQIISELTPLHNAATGEEESATRPVGERGTCFSKPGWPFWAPSMAKKPTRTSGTPSSAKSRNSGTSCSRIARTSGTTRNRITW